MGCLEKEIEGADSAADGEFVQVDEKQREGSPYKMGPGGQSRFNIWPGGQYCPGREG